MYQHLILGFASIFDVGVEINLSMGLSSSFGMDICINILYGGMDITSDMRVAFTHFIGVLINFRYLDLHKLLLLGLKLTFVIGVEISFCHVG